MVARFQVVGGLLVVLVSLVPACHAQVKRPKTAFVVPNGVSFEPAVEYANPDGEHLKLDLARPKTGDGPFPAVVLIHGGGFRAGSRKGHDGLCLRLAGLGYVAVTVDYRLAPKYQFPAAVNDVKEAVRWLRGNASKYHVNPDRIAAVGDSAGGHLALFLGVSGNLKQFEGQGAHLDQPSRVTCVVSLYGPSDLTRSYGRSVDAAAVLPLFLGGDLARARRRHILASPLYWVTPDAAPTLCIQGTKDRYVAYEQSVWMVDRLLAAGVPAQLLTIPGADHGFRGADAVLAEKGMLAFLAQHLQK
jgi:acetyl esterase/lipase